MGKLQNTVNAALTGVSVPRHVIVKNPVDIQLHGFSDAFERAYGTSIHIRSTNAEGKTEVKVNQKF